MKIIKDLQEFLALLQKNDVRYLIVGGYAIAYHARPRYTDDIDIWIEANPANAVKIINVLSEFGFPTETLNPDEISEKGKIIQLGLPPNRIDIITSIEGVDFEEAWGNREKGSIGTIPVNIISFDDLMKNKKSTARLKDRLDVEWLNTYGKKPTDK